MGVEVDKKGKGTKQRRNQNFYKGGAAFSVSLVVLCAAIVYNYGGRLVKPAYPYSCVHEEVKRITWNHGVDFATEVASQDRPVIIQGSPADEWKARHLWNPQYITERQPGQFLNVQLHGMPTFWTFHDSKPFSNVVTQYRESMTWQKLNMSSKEFFQKASHGPPYHYYAAEFQDLGNYLSGDIDPLDSFVVKTQAVHDRSAPGRWTNVWFGGGGGTSQAHFDVYYNFYVQLYGHKRFILFPPEQHENLYIYPYLHPGSLQSQVNFESPNLQKFPHFANASGFIAELSPGDVLYIPPFWFHHVTAIDLSLSVSVWTKFPEATEIHKTWQGNLPLKTSWSQPKLFLATRVYLETIIDRIYGKGSSGPFMKKMIGLRYQSLFQEVPGLLNSETSFCREDLLREIEESEEALMKEFGSEISKRVQQIVSTFDGVHNAARKEIWLGHFCEQVAFTVLGSTQVTKFMLDMSRC